MAKRPRLQNRRQDVHGHRPRRRPGEPILVQMYAGRVRRIDRTRRDHPRALRGPLPLGRRAEAGRFEAGRDQAVDQGRYRSSDRGAPLQIDHTIGIPTNGMWPISWTNQRILIAGGRCKRIGMTASDITIQMKGPYSDATLTTPYGELSNLRIQRARLRINRNTTDHPKATPKCIRTPIANVRAPPLNASAPSSVLATPRKRRCTVE